MSESLNIHGLLRVFKNVSGPIPKNTTEEQRNPLLKFYNTLPRGVSNGDFNRLSNILQNLQNDPSVIECIVNDKGGNKRTRAIIASIFLKETVRDPGSQKYKPITSISYIFLQASAADFYLIKRRIPALFNNKHLEERSSRAFNSDSKFDMKREAFYVNFGLASMISYIMDGILRKRKENRVPVFVPHRYQELLLGSTVEVSSDYLTPNINIIKKVLPARRKSKIPRVQYEKFLQKIKLNTCLVLSTLIGQVEINKSAEQKQLFQKFDQYLHANGLEYGTKVEIIGRFIQYYNLGDKLVSKDKENDLAGMYRMLEEIKKIIIDPKQPNWKTCAIAAKKGKFGKKFDGIGLD